MSYFKTTLNEAGDVFLVVPLLECEETFEYTIPSFPVITVQLRKVRYQAYNDDGGTTAVLDGFIRDDPVLQSKKLPCKIAALCILQVYHHNTHCTRPLFSFPADQ